MTSESLYLFAADSILVAHFLCVMFVVFGLLFVIAGKFLNWTWVRNRLFRIAHLLTIVFVVLQSWLGRICPLTTWEMALREKGGGSTYEGGFIAHWLGWLLYYEAPAWAFVLVYTLFGSVAIFSWFWVRPHSFDSEER